MKRLEGLLPPVITPMCNGRVDPVGVARLVEHNVHLLDGMVVCGSTGEATSMSMAEKQETIRAFADATAGRMTLIVGVAETSLNNIAALIEYADGLGADGYLVPLPFYFRHTGQSIRAFYRAVAGATERPVVLYDNPYTTKTSLTVQDILDITAENGNIRHVKVTDTNLQKVTELHHLDPNLILLAGSDNVMHHQVLRGCSGAVCATPQVYPHAARTWYDALRRGDEPEALKYLNLMLPFINEVMLGPDEYPAIIKMALKRMGIISSDEVRNPLSPLTEARYHEVEAVLGATHLD